MALKITMTAGHGGTDPGAVGNGYEEHAVAWAVVKDIKQYIIDNYVNPDVTVYEEKNSKGQFLSTYGTGKGIYLSFHLNASTDKNANGTEILKGKYGKTYIDQVSEILGKYFKQRGIKDTDTDKFYMLREVEFDGIVEICFISSSNDMEKFFANRDKIIKDLADAIASEAGLNKKTTGGNVAKKQTWTLEKFTSKKGNATHYTPYKIDSKHRFKIIGANTQANAKKYNCPYMRYMKEAFLFEVLVDTNCYSNKPCTKKSGKFLKGERFYGNYAGQIKR